MLIIGSKSEFYIYLKKFIITDKYPTFVTRILMLYGKYFVSFEHFFIDKISNSRYLKG